MYSQTTGYVVNNTEKRETAKKIVASRTISILGVETQAENKRIIIIIASRFLKNPSTQKITEFLSMSLIESSNVTDIV